LIVTAGPLASDRSGYFASTTSAFYWSRPPGIVVMQTLGGNIGAGLHINRTGTIVDWSTNASEQIYAARWNHYTSTPQDLGGFLAAP
jgi:hypothetical protein